MTDLPEYLERGLVVIAYGESKQMRDWLHQFGEASYYPKADADDLRIHIARRLLVLAEVHEDDSEASAGQGAGPLEPRIRTLPRVAHGHHERCKCMGCKNIQAAYQRGEALRQVETY